MWRPFLSAHFRANICQASKTVLLEGYYLNPLHNRNDCYYLILCKMLSIECILILMLITRRGYDSSPSPGWKADVPSWNGWLKIIGLATGWPLAKPLDDLTPWLFHILHSSGSLRNCASGSHQLMVAIILFNGRMKFFYSKYR